MRNAFHRTFVGKVEQHRLHAFTTPGPSAAPRSMLAGSEDKSTPFQKAVHRFHQLNVRPLLEINRHRHMHIDWVHQRPSVLMKPRPKGHHKILVTTF